MTGFINLGCHHLNQSVWFWVLIFIFVCAVQCLTMDGLFVVDV